MEEEEYSRESILEFLTTLHEKIEYLCSYTKGSIAGDPDNFEHVNEYLTVISFVFAKSFILEI